MGKLLYFGSHVMMMIIIKVNYNYHNKISQNPIRQFIKELCNFDKP